MITGPQARVLGILVEAPGSSPRQVARAMWPDSPAWQRRTHRRGAGAGGGGAGAVGGTMPMKAGTMLRRLEFARLVTQYDPNRDRLDDYRWWITAEGRVALAAWTRAAATGRGGR